MPRKASKPRQGYRSKPREPAVPTRRQTVTTSVTAPLSRASRLAGPFALAVFGAPFLILLFYASPAADDFCKAGLSYSAAVRHNALTIMELSYMGWSPRWLTILIQSSAMPHVNLTGAYGWLLLAVVLSNLAALWYFFRTVFRLTPSGAALAAAGFYAAWLATLNNPAEEFYWLTESIEYNLSLGSLLLLLCLLCRPRRNAWYYALIAVLSFAIPGQHEMAGTLLCAILLIAAVTARVGRLPARPWHVSLAFAVPSQAIVMLAPGNASRAALEHRPLWDTAHLWQWLAGASHDGLLWLAHPQILLLACCLLLVRASRPLPDILPRRMAAGVALAAMLAVVGESALIRIASGSAFPDRVAGWLEFWLWLFLLCLVWAAVPKIRFGRWSPAASLLSWCLFAASLFGSPNFHAALADLQGPAQAYWRQNKARLAQRGGPLAPEGSVPYPKLAIPQLLSADSGFWVNQCVANYFDASTVAVSDGKMVVNDIGWVFDADQGWLYRFNRKTPDAEVKYWDSGMKTFWSTSEKTYPYVFRYSDSSSLLYKQGSRNPRQFYNVTAKKWESWP
jgi:hypothetical protein